MPKRRAAASSTRMPAGTVSLPMPSPGMTAMRCVAMTSPPFVLVIVGQGHRADPRIVAHGLEAPGAAAVRRARGPRLAMERVALECLCVAADRDGPRHRGL